MIPGSRISGPGGFGGFWRFLRFFSKKAWGGPVFFWIFSLKFCGENFLGFFGALREGEYFLGFKMFLGGYKKYLFE